MKDTINALAPTGDAEHLNHSGDTGDTGDSPENTGSEASPVENRGPGTPGTGFRIDKKGVWHTPEDGESTWVCSRLDVVAKTRNGDSEAWGRLLEWLDSDGFLHRWSCPMEMLAGDGMEFRRILMSMGLEIAPGGKARQALQTYVQTARTFDRATCVDKSGWLGGAYVLPDETIGEHDGHILLQTPGEPPKLRQAGTPEEWREQVGMYCSGNSRLVLAASVAFAAPLVHLTGEESGGLHFVGPSSCGKTTALRVSASVWGGPEYLKRWRATANGLESVAAAHNDGLLILDELAQVEAREAGGIAYMLANGTGKHRSKRDGMAKPVATWRLLFLSAGEIGLADHMADAGKKAKAGQEVRLCDISADTGEHGMFESLHQFPSGSAFADHLNHASSVVYGSPIRAFLNELAAAPSDDVRAQCRKLRDDFIAEHVPGDADGQPRRVAGRFALVAAGGELATAMGITGWEAGEAIQAAGACYQAWLDRRGGSGSQEATEALATVRHFIEQHGDSRFSHTTDDKPVHNRAGYRRFHDGENQYLFLPEVFKRDVCRGHDFRRVLEVLRERNLLVTEAPDRLTVKPRGVGRCYCVREGIADE